MQSLRVWRRGIRKDRSLLRVTRNLIPLTVTSALIVGCTGVHEYFHNGWKVGPNYCPPAADVSDHWIDYQNPKIQSDAREGDAWWSVFNDPVLTQLIATARHENMSLREATWRIQEARAQRCIAVGELFPQKQQAVGNYDRIEESKNFRTIPQQTGRFFNEWEFGGRLAWELDFWGLYRRAVEAADATLDARIEDYRNVLVLLQAEVAVTYVDVREIDQALGYIRKNLILQHKALKIAEDRFHHGATTEVDFLQATALVAETEALIPPLEIRRRQDTDLICHLLGMPAQEISPRLGIAPIPTAPPRAAVGVPAELLAERPDVRAAEREAAAQNAEIGVATAKLYPHISITGFVGYRADSFPRLFESSSGAGFIGPTFEWDVLNYGRLVNGIKVQDARFEERAYHYRDVVLLANQEVEDALVAFLKSQVLVQDLTRATNAWSKAADLAMTQYQEGIADFNRVFVINRQLVLQLVALTRAQGDVPKSLILAFKAIGGGWKTPIEDTPIDQLQAPTVPPAPPPPPVSPAPPVSQDLPGTVVDGQEMLDRILKNPQEPHVFDLVPIQETPIARRPKESKKESKAAPSRTPSASPTSRAAAPTPSATKQQRTVGDGRTVRDSRTVVDGQQMLDLVMKNPKQRHVFDSVPIEETSTAAKPSGVQAAPASAPPAH